MITQMDLKLQLGIWLQYLLQLHSSIKLHTFASLQFMCNDILQLF